MFRSNSMRQLVLKSFPKEGLVTLSDMGDFKYLTHVLRQKPGDELEARLPDGTLHMMRLVAIDRKSHSITLQSWVPFTEVENRCENRSPEKRCIQGKSMPSPVAPVDFPRMILFQWILKGQKMDQVVRQATETGIKVVIPIIGERCILKDADALGKGRQARWNRIIREARQQSGSPIDTCIERPVGPDEIERIWQAFCVDGKGLPFVLSESPLARKSLYEYLDTNIVCAGIAIGPEGGMTAAELEMLQKFGFCCIHFRTNILRAETAALYGIGAIQTALLESKKWQLKE